MDVPEIVINKGDSLPDEDHVYRIVLETDRDRKYKNLPALRSFSLNEKDIEDGYNLSVEWDKKTTPELTLIRFGATYKFNSKDYKDPTTRSLYSLRVGFLKTIEGIRDVFYDPIFVEPFEKGNPSNSAHSSVNFIKELWTPANEPIIIFKIREHAISRKIDVNMEKVLQELEILRAE